MLNWLKKKLLNKYIADKKGIRSKKITSLQQTVSIGIICTIDSEDAYKDIFSIFSALQQNNKTVRLVGYIDSKAVPFYCLTQLTADYFCQKDLNWYGKPTVVQVYDFMDMDFDMLIDFSHGQYSPLQLICQLSKAKFITGSNPYHTDLYDLHISGDVMDNRSLLNTIDKYSRNLIGEKYE